MERTLVIVKPDGITRGLLYEIVNRARDAGLELKLVKPFRFTEESIAKFYEHLAKESYFKRISDFMISGDSCALIFEGNNSIDTIRTIAGPTNPADAPKGTIRGDYGTELPKNVVHTSDSEASFKREIKLLEIEI